MLENRATKRVFSWQPDTRVLGAVPYIDIGVMLVEVGDEPDCT